MVKDDACDPTPQPQSRSGAFGGEMMPVIKQGSCVGTVGMCRVGFPLKQSEDYYI